jgi:predicted adenine nucleotide alpha hydrolase (AANH) superfamily ATPase
VGDVTLFFSNCNIYPAGEYARRLEEVRKLSRLADCPLVVDEYDHGAWLAAVAGLEDEPERGARCRVCFEFSLGRAAVFAREHGFDALTTSLTISPHKVSATIFEIGQRVADEFLCIDFKKKDGFRRSLELSRAYGMYRQDYCGCEFSLKAARERSRQAQAEAGPVAPDDPQQAV